MENVTITIANWAGVNLGDDAIFNSLLNLIYKNIGVNTTIYVLADNDTFLKSKFKIKDSIRIFEFYKPLNFLKTLYFLHKSDLMIYGGGDLITGNTTSMSLIFLAKILGVPVMYCSIGALPIKSPLKRMLTRIISNKVDLITVRDKYSLNVLTGMNITAPIEITADLAYTMGVSEDKKLNILKKSSNIIGINLRPFDDLYKFHSDRYINTKSMASILDEIIQRYDAELIFIPMITEYRSKKYHSSLETDEKILKSVFDLMKNKDKVITVTKEYDPLEMSQIIRQLDLLIAMRLHALLIASNNGVPIIGINYAPKIKSLFLDNDEYLVPPEKLNIEDFLDVVKKRLKDSQTSDTVEILKNNSEKNATFILKILNQSSKCSYNFYLFLVPSFILIISLNYLTALWINLVSLIKIITLNITSLTKNR